MEKNGKNLKNLKEAIDYNILRSVLNEYSFLFCKGEAANRTLQFIVNASLKFNRIHVKLSPYQFVKGLPCYLIPGLPWSIREIRKARRALKEDGVIFYNYLPNESTRSLGHVVNVVGILDVLKRVLLKEAFPNKLYKRAVKDMQELGVDSNYPVLYQEERVMKLEEAIEKGRKKSIVAYDKNSKKIRLKENPTATDVVSLIREYCKTYEVSYAGRLTQKDKVNMKRWAKTYSAQSGVAPTWGDHLELIIKYWKSINIRWPEGDKQIVLPSTFSWEWYFNRKGISVLIDGWLITHKDDRTVENFVDSIIDLTEKK